MGVQLDIAIQIVQGINSAKLGRQTAVNTEDTVIDQCSNRQEIEDLKEIGDSQHESRINQYLATG